MSAVEDEFLSQVRLLGLPEPFREYQFAAHLGVHWRADFCWFDENLLVEIEGGVHSGGRHVRGVGFSEDCHKYNLASLLGWRLLRFPSGEVGSGFAVQLVAGTLALGAGTAGGGDAVRRGDAERLATCTPALLLAARHQQDASDRRAAARTQRAVSAREGHHE